MGGDGEQGPGELPDAVHVKVLQVLGRQDQRGLLLPHPLQGVADVLDGSDVGQPDIQLVQGGHRIAHSEELIAEKG